MYLSMLTVALVGAILLRPVNVFLQYIVRNFDCEERAGEACRKMSSLVLG